MRNDQYGFGSLGRAALAACLLVGASGCAPLLEHGRRVAERSAEAPQVPVAMTASEAAVYRETNAYRKAHGLSELQPDARLVAIARHRSRDMAKRDYFSHVSPDGADVFALMRHNKLLFAAAGENLARNNYEPTEAPEVAMQGWIKSPGHRANLLHPAFGHIGVGEATAKDGKKYFTQVFTD